MTEHGWPDHDDDPGYGQHDPLDPHPAGGPDDPLGGPDDGGHGTGPGGEPDFWDVSPDPGDGDASHIDAGHIDAGHTDPGPVDAGHGDVDRGPGLDAAYHDSAGADDHGETGDQAVGPVPAHETGVVGADPDALPGDDLPDTAFPPVLDAVPLPEPVDGFPWIDVAGLGAAAEPAAPYPGTDPHAYPDADPYPFPGTGPHPFPGADPHPFPGIDFPGIDPRELAAYAGADLPPDGDPWAALAASPDPATSALARWWADQQPGD